MSAVVAAMLFLAPTLPPETAERYAALVEEHARAAGIPTGLVVAVMFRESTMQAGARNGYDHGLMGIRVTPTLRGRWYGRERLVRVPERNIPEGVRALVHWRNYHQTHCRKSGHPWWSHYQWGGIVRNAESGKRVSSVMCAVQFIVPGPLRSGTVQVPCAPI